jgi:hypothetical protein
VDVTFPAVFFLHPHLGMRDVHVIERCVIVLVCVCRRQMAPILTAVKVMGHVIVLVPCLTASCS